MQHPEALVTEEAGIARSEPVVGREPPGERQRDAQLLLYFTSNLPMRRRLHSPSNEDVANDTLLCGEAVLVRH